MSKWLEKLQNADETRKKRWLIGLSAAAMLIIVALWIFYLKMTIDNVGKVEESPSGITFREVLWQILKNVK
jgi:hypothetical protein